MSSSVRFFLDTLDEYEIGCRYLGETPHYMDGRYPDVYGEHAKAVAHIMGEVHKWLTTDQCRRQADITQSRKSVSSADAR